MLRLPHTCHPKVTRGCPLLLLAAIVVLVACGGKEPPTPAPVVAATPLPAAPATVPATAIPSALPGRTIQLPLGGSVVVPEGALPDGTEVSASLTLAPLLPDGVEAVGDALSISAAVQPESPVFVRLPLPANAGDASGLAIVRVESDGTTTFLMTEVEGSELVAATPGFSGFVVARMLDGMKVNLAGKDQLLPGERVAYRIIPPSAVWGKAAGASWAVSGGASIIHDSADGAIIQAGTELGWFTVTYEALHLASGRLWFGSRRILVTTEPKYLTHGFAVNVMTKTPVVYVGQDVLFTANVFGSFTPPITWTWDFGVGSDTLVSRVTEAGVTHIELPPKRYAPESSPEHYTVTVTATDATSQTVTDEQVVWVAREPFSLGLEGPQRLRWSDPAVYEAYTASARGGEAPYEYAIMLSPGSRQQGGYGPSTEATFSFDQPGAYRLEVSGSDSQDAAARASLPIIVEGGERLSTRLLDLPATAELGQVVTVNVQVRGGVLVVAGKKAGYSLLIDWGDGTGVVPLANVGAVVTPYEGVVVPLSHTYAEAKTYTVRVDAYDATGTKDYDAREITITEATATPTASATEAPPPAEDIVTAETSRWVREGEPLLNASGGRLEYYGGGSQSDYFVEERFLGKFTVYRLSETSIGMDDREVDHGYEYWNVSYESRFDAPPPVLMPGEEVQLAVKMSASGDVAEGMPPGVLFQYDSDRDHRGIIQPDGPVGYNPWFVDNPGVDSGSWTLTVPQGRPGDTFQVEAGWWNCAVCSVTWTYRYDAE